jgi:hypothetical protein
MNPKSVAIVVFGDMDSTRNAVTEDNFKPLAESLTEAGFSVESVLYHDSRVKQLETELLRFTAVLVWVDPIVQGMDRRHLDALLMDISQKGVFVSTPPAVILKIGTKQVLYSTRDMDWGGDTELYADYADFAKCFLSSLDNTSIRILKQYRGSSGSGVFKVHRQADEPQTILVIHAASGNEQRLLSEDEFLNEFKRYFDNNGLLVNQRWVEGITNGMVRCYITGTKVSGFGYQESVALCPHSEHPDTKFRPTSRRFYFSEECGMFQDLRQIMETKWIPQVQEIHGLAEESLPLLWDVDFFINEVNSTDTAQKYTLCEINVSCVTPFPPSCAKYITKELSARFN